MLRTHASYVLVLPSNEYLPVKIGENENRSTGFINSQFIDIALDRNPKNPRSEPTPLL